MLIITVVSLMLFGFGVATVLCAFLDHKALFDYFKSERD